MIVWLKMEPSPPTVPMATAKPASVASAVNGCRRATGCEPEDIRRFFGGLPLALERDDLRITHAAWHVDSVRALQQLPQAGTLDQYHSYEAALAGLIPRELSLAADQEKRHWGTLLHDPGAPVPYLSNVAAADEIYQTANPVRVLTSGLEQRCGQPFFASGKWRMVTRVPWWNTYAETPVIVGHYWRWWSAGGSQLYSRGEPDLFAGAGPLDWMGVRKAVYCTDFSVGARCREIEDGLEPGHFTRLGAVRWPDNEIVFDNGERFALNR